MSDRSGFHVETHARIEPWVIDNVCKPMLRWLPESVSPNGISLLAFCFAWVTFALAAWAPYLEPAGAFAARVGAGLCLFATMVLDCLDGMQARKTGRTSKLGEFLDHWLDAISVPLTGAGFILTLGLDPVTTGLGLLGTGMIYNAQLVLYHQSGRFVHGPTSGGDGQVMLAGVYVLVATFLFIFPRELYWVGLVVTGIGWGIILMQAQVLTFYYRLLRRHVWPHLVFTGLGLGFCVLYWVGFMTTMECILVLTFLSFRINGSYVLFSVVDRAYAGLCMTSLAWLVAIPLAHAFEPIAVQGYTLQAYLPTVYILHLVALNLVDFIRQWDVLKPEAIVHRT